MSLADDAREESRVAELTTALSRAHAKLGRKEADQAELVDAVYRAVRDESLTRTIPPVPKPATDKRRKGEEIAVPLVSDLQLGKVTPDYNSAVAEERMETYAQKIISLTRRQRSDHPVKKATVCFLGDVIEGEAIFPGQSYLVDSGLYRQITVDGPRIVCNFLRTLLTEFESVHVVWVIGNHGRIGGRGARLEHDPETNGDRMLGRICQALLANEPRLTWQIPDGKGERNWYSVAEVGNYKALCIHGDQIRGHSGFPWYGLGKKVNGWASGAIPERFNDVFMGHWHQRALIPLNKRNVYVNGSTESYNTYAQENLAAMSDPSQWLLYVHPEKGRVTSTYGVDL